jgi:WhiB family redox-sensing transcriptional regulator
MNEDWRLDAYCRGKETNLFYPEPGIKGAAEQTKAMKTICALCKVSAECLQTAIENSEMYGIWGGLTPKERTKVRREYSVLTKEIAAVLVKRNVRN